jgi:hypothetical protein
VTRLRGAETIADRDDRTTATVSPVPRELEDAVAALLLAIAKRRLGRERPQQPEQPETAPTQTEAAGAKTPRRPVS